MRRLARTPRQKVISSLWADAHIERVREYKRAYRRRQSMVGQSIQCETILCGGTWVRARYNGRRQFCDECRPIQYEYHRRREA